MMDIKMDKWATHQPLLMYAMLKMTGPVLEIGAGWYSTPLISAYAAAYGRQCVSVEVNKEWAEPLKVYEHDLFKILTPDSYNDPFPILSTGMKWMVAFVDNGPSSRRADDLIRAGTNAHLVVTHDTECNNYGWEKAYKEFEYVYHDKRLNPWATMLSHTMPGLQDIMNVWLGKVE